jgi:hypothetical protein
MMFTHSLFSRWHQNADPEFLSPLQGSKYILLEILNIYQTVNKLSFQKSDFFKQLLSKLNQTKIFPTSLKRLAIFI